jgi:hypothetical protein
MSRTTPPFILIILLFFHDGRVGIGIHRPPNDYSVGIVPTYVVGSPTSSTMDPPSCRGGDAFDEG